MVTLNWSRMQADGFGHVDEFRGVRVGPALVRMLALMVLFQMNFLVRNGFKNRIFGSLGLHISEIERDLVLKPNRI